MARAVITLALDLDRAGDAAYVRSLLVDQAREIKGVKVTESTIAVDESLAHEDVDE